MRHLDDDALAAYYYVRETSPDPTIEEHLAACTRCRSRFDAISLFERELADPETLDLAAAAAERRRMDDATLLFRERLAREDEIARRLLQPLLDSDTPAFVIASRNLPQRPQYRTGGVVRVLCELAAELCERNPEQSRTIAEDAVAIARQLPDGYYPAALVYELRGEAWKALANALVFIGAFRDALDAVNEATDAYRRLLVPESYLAAVAHVRATALRGERRFDEALAAAAEAAREFLRLDDKKRYINARIAEANIRAAAGDTAGARAIIEPLLAIVDEREQAKTVAYLAAALGNYLLDTGDFAEAAGYFARALRIYERLGITAEATRARWSMAYMALLSGDYREAEHRLRIVRAEATTLGMRRDAVLIGIDLAETLVVTGNLRDVARLVDEAFAYFSRAGATTSELLAAHYLREEAARGRLTHQKLRHVSAFMRRLESEPALSFSPPS